MPAPEHVLAPRVARGGFFAMRNLNFRSPQPQRPRVKALVSRPPCQDPRAKTLMSRLPYQYNSSTPGHATITHVTIKYPSVHPRVQIVRNDDFSWLEVYGVEPHKGTPLASIFGRSCVEGTSFFRGLGIGT